MDSDTNIPLTISKFYFCAIRLCRTQTKSLTSFQPAAFPDVNRLKQAFRNRNVRKKALLLEVLLVYIAKMKILLMLH